MRLMLFAPFALYLGYLVYEHFALNKCRKYIKHIIHVNGIRGKTGTARLIDAGLREAGLRVFTKTTGNLPTYINVSGEERPIKRLGRANIREQLKMISLATAENADALILECMAVNPKLQLFSERSMLKSTIGVITNVRYDHILEMGESLPLIAESLSNTIPKDGLLFTADVAFAPYFKEKASALGTKLILSSPSSLADPRMENAALAADVCKAVLGVRPEPMHLLKLEKGDYGAFKVYWLKNSAGEEISFLNLFAVNDPVSALNMLNSTLPDNAQLIYIFNTRLDRPDRTALFAEHFFPHAPRGEIRIIGEAKWLAKRLLQKSGFASTVFISWQKALNVTGKAWLAGLCNMKDPGIKILDALEKGSLKDMKTPLSAVNINMVEEGRL